MATATDARRHDVTEWSSDAADPVPDDPLLQFAAEPERQACLDENPALGTDMRRMSEGTAADEALRAVRQENDELRARLQRSEGALEQATRELSLARSQLATLVGSSHDMSRRPWRLASHPWPIGALPRYKGVVSALLAALAVGTLVWSALLVDPTGVPSVGEELQAASGAEAASRPSGPALPAPSVDPVPARVLSMFVPASAAATPQPPPPAERVVVALDAPRPASAATRQPPAQPQQRASSAPASRPMPFVGTLAIEAAPAGAAVYLNRERVGTTPLTLSGLRAGSHLVWIEREGYRRWTRVVLVPAHQVTKVNAELEALDRQ
jgi:hypothetical protein